MKQIDQIFESKINGRLAHSTIDQVICEFTEFPFTDEAFERYGDEIFKILWQYFELQYEALVPLYNIRCSGTFEMPLANAVLHSGNSSSLLADKASRPNIIGNASDINDNSFLCIPVTGDNESLLAQVELETEQALKVLRFATLWHSSIEGNKRKKINSASFVSLWKTDIREILYHKPNKLMDIPVVHSDCQKWLIIREKDVDQARQYLGLEDINYHYQNVNNPNSDRVRRALELYDSGARALTNWQAVYRYVASINVALPTSSSHGSELTQHLETLIKYGGNYVGTMKKDGSLSDPDTTTWDEMVNMTTKPFERSYKLRSRILHGNEMSEDEISDEDVENVRVLAHNAVRLLAKVARELKWQSYKEAKNWFGEGACKGCQ